jgi:diguanylate cyclase (GGDEF)-like protein
MLVQLQGRIEAEERTRYNANHDELTGLPNRRALIHELKSRLAAKRQTAVMVIDLDRFKIMNDYLGHGAGDRLLVTIADRIRTSIRTNDFAARLGGDEFVFIVDKAKSEMEILATAYRILDVIAQPVAIAGQEVTHTASIGIAMAEPGEQSELDLLGWADVAMYAAKARGRNQAVVYDRELRDEVNDRSRTELMLREAIEMGGLRLHFQPEVDLRDGRVLAAEALVRWEHPTRGLLAAQEFITVAEETGLVTELGRWVFAEACRQLAIWQKEYPNLPFIVRVNMSPADFKMGDLLEFVERCLRENDVPGNRLCIEITEWTVLDEPERIAKILKSFQQLGVEIALDDFGTGWASMTGLKNLPVDLLKLDMSFVRGITTDDYDRAIVDAIIRLGSALNLGVIAEGIESDTIIQKLLELGCYRGQGYLISRPVPAAELSEMLREGSVAASILRSVDQTPVELADF